MNASESPTMNNDRKQKDPLPTSAITDCIPISGVGIQIGVTQSTLRDDQYYSID